MNLNKFIQKFGNYMKQRLKKPSMKAQLESLRVQLNPIEDKTHKSATRKKAVQQLIGMIISDLHRRGRPKKDETDEVSYAA